MTPFAMSSTCEMRLLKYMMRYGLDLCVPGLTREQFAAVPASAKRGIPGIKWMCERLECDLTSLKVAWRDFGAEVVLSGVALAAAVRAGLVADDAIPAHVRVSLVPPYIAGDVFAPVCSMVDEAMSFRGIGDAFHDAETTDANRC